MALFYYVPVISVSLTSKLLDRLDRFIRDRGYSSRSEAVRDALREVISEYELSRFERGRAIATITVISEEERKDVSERLIRLRHEYDDIVSGNMHIHLGERYCLEIFITEGDVKEILSFIDRIRSMRKIKQVKYTVVPIVVQDKETSVI